MHEMALCEGVLAVAVEAAGGERIARVRVRVGELQRVYPESWEMCWEMATMGSPAEGSRAELEEAPARVRCGACGREGHPAAPLDCAFCGAHSVLILAGEELLVAEVELSSGTVIANPGLAPVAKEG